MMSLVVCTMMIVLDTRVIGMHIMIPSPRAMRQFGTYLSAEDMHINSGIGLALRYKADVKTGLVRPNKVFDGKKMEVNIDGVDLHLIHAPGETDDQIVVWIPDKQVLIAADNIYKVCCVAHGAIHNFHSVDTCMI